MTHYYIGTQELLMKALSLKKSYTNNSQVTITEYELNQYIQLVTAEFDKIKEQTGAFDYTIVDGPSPFNYAPISTEFNQAKNRVSIEYDKNKQIYSTKNSSRDLFVLQLPFIPAGLKACLEPVGYKKALNIQNVPSNTPKRYKKASIDRMRSKNISLIQNTIQNEQPEL